MAKALSILSTAACAVLLGGCSAAVDSGSAAWPKAREIGEYRLPVVGITFSPDSKRVATMHHQSQPYGMYVQQAITHFSKLRIWEFDTSLDFVATNLVGIRLDRTFYEATWTPDGGRVLVGASEGVFAWNVAESKLEEFKVGRPTAVGTDGQTIAQNESENDVAIRNLKGDTVANLVLEGTKHEAVRISADGGIVATLTNRYSGPYEVVIWSVASQQPRCRFPVLAGSRCFFELSRDGRRFAGGSIDEQLLRVRDTVDGRIVGEFDVGTDDIWEIAISADGRLLAAGTEGTPEQRCGVVRVWDIDSGEMLTEIVEKDCWGVTAVAFSPDGKTLAAGTSKGEVKFYDVPTSATSTE